ncbi:hypothetical protein [Micromonospora rubida]
MMPAAGSAPGRAPLRELSRRIGWATVTVEAREQLGTQVDALLDIITAYADELRDGLSVQAGWAPFMLVARGEDRFGVVAPDFVWAEVSPAQPPRVASAGPGDGLLGSCG